MKMCVWWVGVEKVILVRGKGIKHHGHILGTRISLVLGHGM